MKRFLLSALVLFLVASCKKDISDTPNAEQATAKSVTLKKAGTDLQTLIRQWTEWVYGHNKKTDPINDPDGSRQSQHQPNSSGVFMLAGGQSEGISRTVTINYPKYQHVLVPLVNLSAWLDECDPGFGPAPGQTAENFFTTLFMEPFSGQRNLTLTMDGTSLLKPNQADMRANSGVWSFGIHNSWNYGCNAKDPSTFYTDGFWALVPLTPGTHTLTIGGDFDWQSFGWQFSNSVTYTLIVK